MVGGWGEVFLGEAKTRRRDIISFSLDYLSKSKVQTNNPSSSPPSLDTAARPADYMMFWLEGSIINGFDTFLGAQIG